MRLLLVLGLLSTILAGALTAQERAPRREGPPRAELRERLREAMERMPRLRERLEERRGKLRERLREAAAERRQLEARGKHRSERGARPLHARPRFQDGARRAFGLDELRRPLLPPRARERMLRELREAGPRHQGNNRPPRPVDREPPRGERRDRRSV